MSDGGADGAGAPSCLGRVSLAWAGLTAAAVVLGPLVGLVAFIVAWGLGGLWDGDLGAVMGLFVGVAVGAMLPPVILVGSFTGLLASVTAFVTGYRWPGALLGVVHGLVTVVGGVVLFALTIPVLRGE